MKVLAFVALSLDCFGDSLHVAQTPARPGLGSLHRRFFRARLAAAPAVVDASPETPPKRAGLGSMKLYNTMARAKEPFEPKAPPYVSMYTCGPTIYDFAHIGNFRAFLTYDILKRWLTWLGYDVEHVCNLTDIDDKIIARIQRDGVSLKELTDKYANYFFEDLSALNVIPAKAYPRATEHVGGIVDMVQKLMDKGAAYSVSDSVYFDVSKAATYGRLARLDTAGLLDGQGEGGGFTDGEQFASDKKGSRDFALWKAYKEADGEVAWESSLGKGRPGWHIECSAMVQHFFGKSVDLHAGGIDLAFPHHTNEIAQSEALNDEEFCKHWVHNGFVNVNNEKMSKSLGNFVTLRESFKTPLDVRAFRYLVVLSQYRSPLNFNGEAIAGAKTTLKKLDKFRNNLLDCAAAATTNEEEEDSATEDADEASAVTAACETAVEGLSAAMNDDLNTPRAGASLFGLLKKVQPLIASNSLTQASAAEVLACLDTFNGVLGIWYDMPTGYFASEKEAASGSGSGVDGALSLDEIPAEVSDLINQRVEAKAAKDFALADALRAQISELGFVVVDGGKNAPPTVTRVEA